MNVGSNELKSGGIMSGTHCIVLIESAACLCTDKLLYPLSNQLSPKLSQIIPVT